jgi:hypothetical protein
MLFLIECRPALADTAVFAVIVLSFDPAAAVTAPATAVRLDALLVTNSFPPSPRISLTMSAFPSIFHQMSFPRP